MFGVSSALVWLGVTMNNFKFQRRPSAGGGGLNSCVAGETLSEKNAIAEFLLKEEDIQKACENGDLAFSWRSCHGNSYRLFNRREIRALADRCEPDPSLKAKMEKQKHKERVANSKTELESVSSELANIDKRKEFLVRRKAELEEFLKENVANKGIKRQQLLVE